MPYKLRLSEDEVKKELARLGYTDVDEETVTSMRKDLFKLIKADLRKLKQERHQREDSASSHHTVGDVFTPRRSHRHKKHSHLPPSDTSSTSTTQQSSKDLTTSLEVTSNTESGYSGEESTTSSCSYRTRPSRTQEKRPPDIQTIRGKGSSDGDKWKRKSDGLISQQPSLQTLDKTTGDTRPKREHDKKKKDDNKKLSKPAKCNRNNKDKDTMPAYPSRPDPVNLYHYYKAHWDKFKVPGDDPRLKLRWAVRTKLFYAE
ncbi:hypothetical protein Pmani_026171 [Petrolisthes manimaculis]|uniref:Centriolar and ciliogenesis-associated protein HYLS1 C-terminal domain-containing protein n=1 Tax=Petrolisthes manimaculis TaxID=1843537 RepID=A0AAE1U0C9_9EUCA|nr:hypothetical protein Pmani_026171 [Petrolisthes manimaculis]